MVQNAQFAMEYTNFSGNTTRISILSPRRFAPRPPLVANKSLCLYRTWDIFVGKRNCCYESTWDICVGKLHLAPAKEWSRGDGHTHPTYLKKLKLPLNVSQKFTLLNVKPILLKTIFSLFYINKLRMSDSLADVMSYLYMLLASFISWINQ